MRLNDVAVILTIIVAIIAISTFLAGVWDPPQPTPEPTPTPVPTPTPITEQPPTPLYPPYTLPPTNNPPDAFVDSINPSKPLQGQSVTFTCHGYDPDSGDYITEYRWESSIDGVLSNQKTFSISSLSSGLHQIILRVKDSHGQWSSEIIRNLRVEAIEISSTEIDDATPEPGITPTPTPTPTPSPTATSTSIIDTMDSISGWRTDKHEGSINIKSVPGRTGNAIEIAFDLKEWGYVWISKVINPEILSNKEGIRFFYKGSGEPNTIALKLVYGDVDGTTFGVLWNSATVTDDWVTVEVPYGYFDCWWPQDSCLRYGNELDLNNVRKIEFAISNRPEEGDVCGSGKVIIDDVQGIGSVLINS